MQTVEAKARRIRVAVFDVDGVMTDGTLYLDDAGNETKGFNSLDGHGLKMLAATGVLLAIITGRTSRCVELRAQNLGITLVRQGVEDKLSAFGELLSDLGLDLAEAAYMGDDVVDLPVLRRCGLALSVPRSPDLVRRHVDYVTAAGGGQGAVREVCELIMRAQGTLDAQLAKFLA
jgi:3-deoxy-D-manno-octulosonate 8-phosphate phosphatase (KDO 8-P phosphatase)